MQDQNLFNQFKSELNGMGIYGNEDEYEMMFKAWEDSLPVLEHPKEDRFIFIELVVFIMLILALIGKSCG